MKCEVVNFMPIFRRKIFRIGERGLAVSIPYDLVTLFDANAGDIAVMDIGVDNEKKKYIVIKINKK